jgi:energy-coupling factor transporter transmembrane protein EcfT
MKFLQNITLGQYMPGDSFLHRLDPRTKFVSLLLLMIVTFLVKTFPALALMGAVFVVALLSTGLSWTYVFRGVRSFLWLFLFTGILHFFFTPGPSLPFFPIGFLNLTWTGLERGLFVSAQLIFFLQKYWVSRKSYVTVTGKPSASRIKMDHPLLNFFWYSSTNFLMSQGTATLSTPICSRVKNFIGLPPFHL